MLRRLSERLPLVVVALMVAIGVGLELVRFGALDPRSMAPLAPMAPLVVLLVVTLARRPRAGDEDAAR